MELFHCSLSHESGSEHQPITTTEHYQPTSTTDKSSSRWSPKSRLDGNDAPSLLNLAPYQLQPTQQPHKQLRAQPLRGALYHHIYYILFNLHPSLGSEVTISAISIRLFNNIFGSRRGGQEHEFHRFLFSCTTTTTTTPAFTASTFFQHKKEKGGCPLMIPPREGTRGETPFSDERMGFYFWGTG